MDDLLEALCYLLEDELERQENVLAICRAQGQAARTHDVECLEARTAALLPLIQEGVQADGLRTRLLAQIAARAGMSVSRPCLSDVIPHAAEPCASRLRFYQSRLVEILGETKSVVRANAIVLRGSLRVVSQAMKALEQCSADAASYDAQGMGPQRANALPTVIDQRG